MNSRFKLLVEAGHINHEFHHDNWIQYGLSTLSCLQRQVLYKLLCAAANRMCLARRPGKQEKSVKVRVCSHIVSLGDMLWMANNIFVIPCVSFYKKTVLADWKSAVENKPQGIWSSSILLKFSLSTRTSCFSSSDFPLFLLPVSASINPALSSPTLLHTTQSQQL